MHKILTNKKFLIALAIIAIIALFFSFLPKRVITPTLLSSIPVDKATKVSVFEPLSFTFDQNLLPNLVTINSIPEESWDIEQEGPNKIILNHKKFLIVNQSYVVSVYYNKKLASTITFTTKAEQNDPRYLQTVQTTMDRDYPIAVKLPYSTDSYRVVYSAPMILEISLKNENITPEKAFSDIRAWVTSVGGDASAHKYIISDKPLPSTTTPTPATPTKTSKPSPTPFDWDTLQDDGT
ncbi:MAG: Ig-like domain-containing protein [bacterium]